MASMKFKAIGIVPTLMLCSAGVHISNVYLPDDMRFFAGYFCGVAAMFVTAVLRNRDSRAQVAEKVALAVEPLPVADTYRAQALGDAQEETTAEPVRPVSTAPRDPHHESYRRDLKMAEMLIKNQEDIREILTGIKEIHDMMRSHHMITEAMIWYEKRR